MEPNNVTCRPQLIKILLASSLCLSDLDLIQFKAESAAELERKKCSSVCFAHKGPSPIL